MTGGLDPAIEINSLALDLYSTCGRRQGAIEIEGGGTELGLSEGGGRKGVLDQSRSRGIDGHSAQNIAASANSAGETDVAITGCEF